MNMNNEYKTLNHMGSELHTQIIAVWNISEYFQAQVFADKANGIE